MHPSPIRWIQMIKSAQILSSPNQGIPSHSRQGHQDDGEECRDCLPGIHPVNVAAVLKHEGSDDDNGRTRTIPARTVKKRKISRDRWIKCCAHLSMPAYSRRDGGEDGRKEHRDAEPKRDNERGDAGVASLFDSDSGLSKDGEW